MRDFKKETEWRKNKYKRLVADVDKDIANKFQEQLKKDNIKFSDWIKENIKNYLEKNK